MNFQYRVITIGYYRGQFLTELSNTLVGSQGGSELPTGSIWTKMGWFSDKVYDKKDSHINLHVGLNTYSKAPVWIWQTHGIGNTNPTPSLPNLWSRQILDCITPLQMSPTSLLFVNRFSRQLLPISLSWYFQTMQSIFYKLSDDGKTIN